ncbi:MAG: hypothetical protein Q8P67_26260 [archaeon]|nr:hypothetical protein [archaeon]
MASDLATESPEVKLCSADPDYLMSLIHSTSESSQPTIFESDPSFLAELTHQSTQPAHVPIQISVQLPTQQDLVQQHPAQQQQQQQQQPAQQQHESS